jgi:hypothetical protein
VPLVWNDTRGRGRLLSLHYERMPLERRLRLLLAIAESEPR